jgi:long-chain acyl-CoA synthetase
MEARTLSELVTQLGNLGSRRLFVHRTEFRTYTWSYQQVQRAAYRVAALLQERGIKQGDRVIFWGPNSPEWATAFLGCLLGGIVAVPIDLRFRPDFLQEVRRQTEAGLLLTTRSKPDPELGIPSIPLEQLGEAMEKVRLERYEPPRIAEDDLAEILYTSGTTGKPKGVMLTHRNLLSELEGFQPVVPPEPEYRFLSVLPLSHIFEQMGGLLLPIVRGALVVYIGSIRPSALLGGLQEQHPNAMMVVPRLLELLRDRTVAEIKGYPLGPRIFDLLMRLAPSLSLQQRRLLFWPLHRRLGGSLKYLVSGGAALDPDLQRFWEAVGMVVLQGYGLTETSSAVTCNRMGEERPGSVGKPLQNQEVRLASDGEILVRGPNVTPGYYRSPDLTAAAFEDGWFKTGDMGQFDEDGHLVIRGRKKEMIVTATGINVYPEDVEAALDRVPGVKDSAVVEWHGKVHAVLLLEEGIRPDQVVREANKQLDPSQKILGHTVWPQPDFPRTPTMKVSRRLVLEQLKEMEKGGRATASARRAAPPVQREVTPVQRLVAEVAEVPASRAAAAAQLGIDLEMDSIELLELVSHIEQELGVDLPEEMVTTETTVAQLEEMVRRKGIAMEKISFPLWPLSPPVQEVRRTLQRLLVFPILGLFCELNVEGYENLQGLSEPHLLAANHTSMLDAPVILMALPEKERERTAIAAWAEYFEAPGRPRMERILRRLEFYLAATLFGIFPLPQTRVFRSSIRHTGALLDRGWNALIFPEGARTRTGEMGSFKEGVGVMASWLRVPVVPIRVEGLFELLPVGRVRPRRGKVTVRFGQPLRFPSTASYLEITRTVEEAVRGPRGREETIGRAVEAEGKAA